MFILTVFICTSVCVYYYKSFIRSSIFPCNAVIEEAACGVRSRWISAPPSSPRISSKEIIAVPVGVEDIPSLTSTDRDVMEHVCSVEPGPPWHTVHDVPIDSPMEKVYKRIL
jgi:hypothetical protein